MKSTDIQTEVPPLVRQWVELLIQETIAPDIQLMKRELGRIADQLELLKAVPQNHAKTAQQIEASLAYGLRELIEAKTKVLQETFDRTELQMAALVDRAQQAASRAQQQADATMAKVDKFIRTDRYELTKAAVVDIVNKERKRV